MSTICINKSGYSMPVYANYNGTTKIGEIYHNELYTEQGFFSEGDGQMSVAFRSPNEWTSGYVMYNHHSRPGSTNDAFGPSYAFDTQAYGYEFPVRLRQCRIFSGENHVATIYPGDKIITDGWSSAGSYHPYRLSVKGFQRAGQSTVLVTNGWCDVDIEIGYSMYNQTTVYGKW